MEDLSSASVVQLRLALEQERAHAEQLAGYLECASAAKLRACDEPSSALPAEQVRQWQEAVRRNLARPVEEPISVFRAALRRAPGSAPAQLALARRLCKCERSPTARAEAVALLGGLALAGGSAALEPAAQAEVGALLAQLARAEEGGIEELRARLRSASARFGPAHPCVRAPALALAARLAARAPATRSDLAEAADLYRSACAGSACAVLEGVLRRGALLCSLGRAEEARGELGAALAAWVGSSTPPASATHTVCLLQLAACVRALGAAQDAPLLAQAQARLQQSVQESAVLQEPEVQQVLVKLRAAAPLPQALRQGPPAPGAPGNVFLL